MQWLGDIDHREGSSPERARRPRPDVNRVPSGWVSQAGIGERRERVGGNDVVGDAAMAGRVIRTHCKIDWPRGPRCLNCHRAFPCPDWLWAFRVLEEAGWSEDEISKLDTRTGPWS
jgi:hypothetical protein